MINKRFFKTKDEVEVTFEVAENEVGQSVAIVADFLDWEPTEMKRVAKSKSFKFRTRLPKDSQFEFRYLVDNEKWINDANADCYQPNGYGEDNGLISTYQ